MFQYIKDFLSDLWWSLKNGWIEGKIFWKAMRDSRAREAYYRREKEHQE
jgi:hypothetical protein